MASDANVCYNATVSYTDRVDNPAGWNWCLVPDGGPDAVFFAAMAIVTTALASPRWDALISLFAGGVYQIFAYYYNLGHVSNAVNLWLGMRPADIFVYVFLPPLLLDVSVRLDFFMLKKHIVHVMLAAFAMVITTCLVLIPFMLYALDLKSSGWSASYVALFGAAIASTDAAAVCAALSAGGAPEILIVLLEGESIFNDASSLTLFAIFKEVVESQTVMPLGQQIGEIVAKTTEAALVGVAVGIALGIFNKYVFVWLQYRNMPHAIEVGFTVGGAYMSFYITQVWCKGSGCVGTVAYGLYGSATLLWGMSNKVRQSGIFQHFWTVMTFLVNSLIFFYVGASCVNFMIRSSNELYGSAGSSELAGVILYKLPLIYLYVFAVRSVFLFASFKALNVLRVGSNLSWQEITFLSMGGLRGSLSLVLAQTIVTLTTSSGPSDQSERVKAEAAMYTAGFVVMTMLINAPLSVPLMTLLKLNKISKEQLMMRGHVKDQFFRFTYTSLEELQGGAEDDEMLQGVDWPTVEGASDFQEVLDRQLPEDQPCIVWRDYYYPRWLRACFAWCGSWCKAQPAGASVVDPEDLDAGYDADDRAAARDDKAAAREVKALLKGELSRMTAWSIKQEADGPTTNTPRGPVLIISDSNEWGGLADQGPAHSLPNPMHTGNYSRGLMKSKSLPKSKGSAGMDEHHATNPALRTLNTIYHGLTATGPTALSKVKAMTVTRAAAMRTGGESQQQGQQQQQQQQGQQGQVQVQGDYSGGKERAMSRAAAAAAGATLAKMNGDLSSKSKTGLATMSKPQEVAYSSQSATSAMPSHLAAPDVAAAFPRRSPGNAAAAGLTGASSRVGPSDEDFRLALSGNQPGGRAASGDQAGVVLSGHRQGAETSASSSGQYAGVECSTSPPLEAQMESLPLLGAAGGAAAGGTTSAQVALTILPDPMATENTSLPAIPHPLLGALPSGTTTSDQPAINPEAPEGSLVGLALSPQRTGTTSTGIQNRSRLGQSNSTNNNLTELGNRRLVRSKSGPNPNPDPDPNPTGGLPGHQRAGPSGVDNPQTQDSFLAGSQASLLVIYAARQPAGADKAWTGDVDARERQDILRNAMSQQTPTTHPHHRIVQRRMGDGFLATTSMHTRPQGRAGLARTSLDLPGHRTANNDFPASVPEEPSNTGQRDRSLGRYSQQVHNSRASEAPWGPSARATVAGGSPGRSLVRPSRGVAGAADSGPLGRPSRALARAESEAAPLGRGSQPLVGGETPLARASRAGSLGRASTRSTQFLGEVAAADGGQAVFSSTAWENGAAGIRGADLSSEAPPVRTRPQLLHSSSMGGARMSAMQQGRTPVGTKFFAQAQERQLASRSAVTAQAYLDTGEEPLHEDMPYVLRDPADFRRSSRTGVQLMHNSHLSGRAYAIGSPEEEHHEMLMEHRLRLLTGLKSYFKERFTDGLLSPQSYKVLWYITSKAHNMADRTLALWDLAKQEVSSSRLLQLETQLYYWFKGRINGCKRSPSWWRRQLLGRILTGPAWLLSQHLSSVQLAGLEAAVELWIGLTSSLQTQWLQYSGQYGALVLQEATENAEGAWSYIVDRRIEDPDKFQAIQTYRASVHLISQQLTFVHEMSRGGMIDEKEALRMEDTMQKRLQRVCRTGPQWRRQSVQEILSAIPFLRNIHPKVVDWIRSHSTIKVYGQGECIWEHWASNSSPPSMFIVLSGVVRLMIQMHDHAQPIYLGSGGVGGLISVVLDDVVPGVGMRAAYAEGNAMGKGPVVMHIPRELFVAIQRFSRDERLATWQQLELNIYRTAAAFVLDLLRAQVVTQLGTFVRSALAACVVSDRHDSKVARRQRIRALLKDAFEGEGHETNVNHLDWVGELINVPRPVALALLDGSLDLTLANAPWHKAMFQAIAATTSAVYELIRASVRESWLVVLAPEQTVWQTSTMVLIQGSLIQQVGSMPPASPTASPGHPSGNCQGAAATAAQQPTGTSSTSSGPLVQPPQFASAADLLAMTDKELSHHKQQQKQQQKQKQQQQQQQEQQEQQEGFSSNNAVAPAGSVHAPPAATFTATPNPDHIAPSVMVWTADYFDVEVPMQPPVPITAGVRGATLLVWGVDPDTLLSGVKPSAMM